MAIAIHDHGRTHRYDNAKAMLIAMARHGHVQRGNYIALVDKYNL